MRNQCEIKPLRIVSLNSKALNTNEATLKKMKDAKNNTQKSKLSILRNSL